MLARRRCWSLVGSMTLVLGLSAAGEAQSAHEPLRQPAVLENLYTQDGKVVVELTAAPARLELIPGVKTEVFAYNGTVPGPTLELREGERVVVRFRNELDAPTTVHWHGIHLPFEADGSPFHPVAPGEEYEYSFTVREGSAGTYWYHPHPHHHTAQQVAKGLYGAVVVRAAEDPLPWELSEKLLILSDNRFAEDGSVDFAAPRSRQARVDEENGREGDVLFVNGQIRPTLEIGDGEVQRWRVLNGSGARTYRLHLPEHELLQIGSDGGLFERPLPVDEVLLAGGERVELLVRRAADAGERAALQDLPYDRYLPQTRPRDWEVTRELLEVRHSGAEPREPPTIPEILRPVPAIDPAEATINRRMTLTKNRINGRTMDMDRVDVTTRRGAVEIWEIENLVGMDHTFHLHGLQFQVLDRNGVAEPFASWKDTVNIPQRETVHIIVRFDMYPGKWMFHCHILDHEDAGMMGVLEVK